jgi:transposase
VASRPPAGHQKKAAACRGVVLFEDEASFWLDGTLHQTWSRVGVQPRVDTFGQRKTAHVFGAVAVDDADFTWMFAERFNGHTFHGAPLRGAGGVTARLEQLVARYAPRKVFVIMDNGSCHWLDDAGKRWLSDNGHAVELHRLPPYSPLLPLRGRSGGGPRRNPVEGIWKATRKRATHNRFYRTVEERDTALRQTFSRFQSNPRIIEGQVRRWR